MHGLDVVAEAAKRLRRGIAQARNAVVRPVEVTAAVDRLQPPAHRGLLVVSLKHEEFDFAGDPIVEAQLGRLRQYGLERVAWIGQKWLPIRQVEVAQESGCRSRLPG